MHIYCIHIDSVLDETIFNEMIDFVSFEKKAKINRFRKPIDAIRSLYGDLIIRLVLCKHYGFTNDKILYGYQEFGKPYLLQHPHLHFNISHSGDWVVGVVSTDLIGIDVEKIISIKQDVSLLALTNEENKKIQQLNEIDKSDFFFTLWTLKESYAKATGKGLSEGLNTLSISTDNDIISIKKNEKRIQAYFEILECIEGYKFCWCSLSKQYCKGIKLFSIDEFNQEAKQGIRI